MNVTEIDSHLVIQPLGGLCNRIRSIAAARRLANLWSCRCTIIWEWGSFAELFKLEPDFNVVTTPAHFSKNGYVEIKHNKVSDGGNYEQRLLTHSIGLKAIISSGHLFGGKGEPRKTTELDLRPWLLQPSAEVLAEVESHLAKWPRPLAGVHVRGTDNVPAIESAPRETYVPIIINLASQGFHIFLATEDRQSEIELEQASRVSFFRTEKFKNTTQTWPREHTATEDVRADLIDLFLLSSCDAFVGVAASSYSRFATYYANRRPTLLLNRARTKNMGESA